MLISGSIRLCELGLLRPNFIFDVLCYLRNASKPEICSLNSGVVTYLSENGVILRLGWDTSTKAVGGTLEKPS